MKIVFFGTGSFGLPSLEALQKSSHDISAVVVIPEKPSGRNLRSRPSPIKEWAIKHNLPVLDSTLIDSEKGLKQIKSLAADLFVVISFGKILKKEAIEIPRLMTLNLHASLLPRYRGAAPIHWALMNADAETGVSVMRMIEKLDAGDVLLQKKTNIGAEDDIVTLERRLSLLGRDVLMEVILLLESGKAGFVAQERRLVSYARKITKEDACIDWGASAVHILGKIRALKAWPSVHFMYEGNRIKILEAELAPAGVSGREKPGTILTASPKEGIQVATTEGALRIKRLQLEGRKELEAGEFVKGFRLLPGSTFE